MIGPTILATVETSPSMMLDKSIQHFHQLNMQFDGTLNHLHHMVLATEASNETFTFKEAMQETDYRDFIQAMIKEVDDHEQRNHWTLMERQALPQGVKTIMSIWSFKRKRYPDGK
jgi:chloramphenicol O-acetyltransferase